MKFTEFYLEKQGRPESKVSLDMETRLPSIPYSYISKIVNQILEDAMKKELTEMVNKLEQLYTEIKQIKLHLAAGSDQHIDEESVRED